MRLFARTRATRSIVGTWASLLVLVVAVVPGTHVHTCDANAHGRADAVASIDAAAPTGPTTPVDAVERAHDCAFCRLLSQTGALTPDVATPSFLVANDPLPAVDVASVLPAAPLRDDLGRGPPARTR